MNTRMTDFERGFHRFIDGLIRDLTNPTFPDINIIEFLGFVSGALTIMVPTAGLILFILWRTGTLKKLQ